MHVVGVFVFLEYLALISAVIVAATVCGTLGMTIVFVVYQFKVSPSVYPHFFMKAYSRHKSGNGSDVNT